MASFLTFLAPSIPKTTCEEGLFFLKNIAKNFTSIFAILLLSVYRLLRRGATYFEKERKVWVLLWKLKALDKIKVMYVKLNEVPSHWQSLRSHSRISARSHAAELLSHLGSWATINLCHRISPTLDTRPSPTRRERRRPTRTSLDCHLLPSPARTRLRLAAQASQTCARGRIQGQKDPEVGGKVPVGCFTPFTAKETEARRVGFPFTACRSGAGGAFARPSKRSARQLFSLKSYHTKRGKKLFFLK